MIHHIGIHVDDQRGVLSPVDVASIERAASIAATARAKHFDEDLMPYSTQPVDLKDEAPAEPTIIPGDLICFNCEIPLTRVASTRRGAVGECPNCQYVWERLPLGGWLHINEGEPT
jgi:hypothetical protein